LTRQTLPGRNAGAADVAGETPDAPVALAARHVARAEELMTAHLQDVDRCWQLLIDRETGLPAP
jgi:hypothetical protein